MVLISCDDCEGDTFKINWWPPNNAEAICVNCGNKTGIGGEDTSNIDPEDIDGVETSGSP